MEVGKGKTVFKPQILIVYVIILLVKSYLLNGLDPNMILIHTFVHDKYLVSHVILFVLKRGNYTSLFMRWRASCGSKYGKIRA